MVPNYTGFLFCHIFRGTSASLSCHKYTHSVLKVLLMKYNPQSSYHQHSLITKLYNGTPVMYRLFHIIAQQYRRLPQ
jgi:hypothetical protein